MKSWIQSSVSHDLSDIIFTCSFDTQVTFFIIITTGKNTALVNIFVETVMYI